MIIRLKLGMRKGSWEFITAETFCGKVKASPTLLEKEAFDIGNGLYNDKKGVRSSSGDKCSMGAHIPYMWVYQDK